MAILTIVLLLAFTPTTSTQNFSGPDSDEYEIYTLILNVLFTEKDYVLINDQTTARGKLSSSVAQTVRVANRQVRGDIPFQLRDDFITKNKTRYQLEDRFNLSSKTILMNQAEIDELVGNGEWTEFLKKYPGHGVVDLSRVGFNAHRDRALVYAATQGGPKSGIGLYLLLSKKSGNWTIDRKIVGWLS